MYMIDVLPPTPKQAARIMARFEPQANDCHYWTGSLQSTGYGCVGYVSDSDGVHIYLVHRVVWVIHHGPIPIGMLIRHACEKDYLPSDQTFKRCGNIDHLVLGTMLDNAHDRIANGRERKGYQKGEHNGNSRLSENDVQHIHQMRAEGYSLTEIGDAVGTCFQNVSLVVSGKHWAHMKPSTTEVLCGG